MMDSVVAMMSTKKGSISSHKEEKHESLQKYIENKFACLLINIPTCYRQSSPAFSVSCLSPMVDSSPPVLSWLPRSAAAGRARRQAGPSYAQLGAARQAAPLEAPACPNPKACLHYLTLRPAAEGIIRSRSSNRATS